MTRVSLIRWKFKIESWPWINSSWWKSLRNIVSFTQRSTRCNHMQADASSSKWFKQFKIIVTTEYHINTDYLNNSSCTLTVLVQSIFENWKSLKIFIGFLLVPFKNSNIICLGIDCNWLSKSPNQIMSHVCVFVWINTKWRKNFHVLKMFEIRNFRNFLSSHLNF